jgi:hypothetical protein
MHSGNRHTCYMSRLDTLCTVAIGTHVMYRGWLCKEEACRFSYAAVIFCFHCAKLLIANITHPNCKPLHRGIVCQWVSGYIHIVALVYTVVLNFNLKHCTLRKLRRKQLPKHTHNKLMFVWTALFRPLYRHIIAEHLKPRQLILCHILELYTTRGMQCIACEQARAVQYFARVLRIFRIT